MEKEIVKIETDDLGNRNQGDHCQEYQISPDAGPQAKNQCVMS